MKLATFAPTILRIDRRLSDDETVQVQGAIMTIQRFETDQHLFLLVKANYADLTSAVEAFRRQLEERGAAGQDGALLIRFDLNRRLLNYLASVRCFLDQTCSVLSRRYGKSSQPYIKFSGATNTEYDAHFHYRFADDLRNYVQHYGFGIDHISASVEVNEFGTHSASLELQFNRDALLQSGWEWKARVRDELTAGPPEIEVLGLMSGLDESMMRLGSVRIEIESPHAIAALQVLQPYIDEAARIGEGVPHLIDDDFTQNDGGVLEAFPMKTIIAIKAALR